MRLWLLLQLQWRFSWLLLFSLGVFFYKSRLIQRLALKSIISALFSLIVLQRFIGGCNLFSLLYGCRTIWKDTCSWLLVFNMWCPLALMVDSRFRSNSLLLLTKGLLMSYIKCLSIYWLSHIAHYTAFVSITRLIILFVFTLLTVTKLLHCVNLFIKHL